MRATASQGRPAFTTRVDTRSTARPAFATRIDTRSPQSPPVGDFRGDGVWMSDETGIGTEIDKRTSHVFVRSRMSYEEIARLWEQGGLASKVIEKPSFEAYREGYEIEIADEGNHDDLKEQLINWGEDIELDWSMKRAHQLKRAFGGSLILLGVDDGRPMSEPLNEDRIKSFDWLNVLEPIEVSPAAEYDDPGKPKYGKPMLFEINTDRRSGLLLPGAAAAAQKPPTIKPGTLVHESRCIVFRGIHVSDYTFPFGDDVSPYWGSSVVHRFVDALRDYEVAFSAAGLLPVDISQPVISTPQLKEMVAKNKEGLRARLRNIEKSRSVARAILIGTDEKYERQTTQLSNIPELLDRLSQRFAGDADMPLSVAIGYSPATLGAPDDKEMTLWFNIVRAMQRDEFTRPTKRVYGLKMRLLRQRKIPKHWKLTWLPLEHQTLAQQVESERVQAQTDSLNIKSGMLYPDEARKSRWKGGYSHRTQIDEKKPAPGFAAPQPAGVFPGTTPAVHGVPGAPGAPATMGPNAHTVTGYARRNPTPPALGANPKAGGDAPPSDRGDATESAYQRDMLKRLQASGRATPAMIALLENLITLSEVEEAREAEEEAQEGEEETAEVENTDADGPGQHRIFAGLSVVVENPRGSTRTWVDTDGTAGKTTMKYDYGYLVGAIGADGDSVDCYLGPNEGAPMVYVVHQMSKASGFQAYDEDKVMLGFDSVNHACDAYLRQYDDERFLGDVTTMTLDGFKRWLASSGNGRVTPAEMTGQ